MKRVQILDSVTQRRVAAGFCVMSACRGSLGGELADGRFLAPSDRGSALHRALNFGLCSLDNPRHEVVSGWRSSLAPGYLRERAPTFNTLALTDRDDFASAPK
jgi:hypothetical protein